MGDFRTSVYGLASSLKGVDSKTNDFILRLNDIYGGLNKYSDLKVFKGKILEFLTDSFSSLSSLRGVVIRRNKIFHRYFSALNDSDKMILYLWFSKNYNSKDFLAFFDSEFENFLDTLGDFQDYNYFKRDELSKAKVFDFDYFETLKLDLFNLLKKVKKIVLNFLSFLKKILEGYFEFRKEYLKRSNVNNNLLEDSKHNNGLSENFSSRPNSSRGDGFLKGLLKGYLGLSLFMGGVNSLKNPEPTDLERADMENLSLISKEVNNSRNSLNGENLKRVSLKEFSNLKSEGFNAGKGFDDNEKNVSKNLKVSGLSRIKLNYLLETTSKRIDRNKIRIIKSFLEENILGDNFNGYEKEFSKSYSIFFSSGNFIDFLSSYNPHIFKQINFISKKEGVDPRLIHFIAILESYYHWVDLKSISRNGDVPNKALGPIQVMPETFKENCNVDYNNFVEKYGVLEGRKKFFSNRYLQIVAGIREFKKIARKYNLDISPGSFENLTFVDLTILFSSYNAGIGIADRDLKRVLSYNETKRYVLKLYFLLNQTQINYS